MVNPGDMIVADAAGVVVVPQGIAAELLERLKPHEEANAAYFESVRRGDFSNAWVDRVLAEHGCPVVRGSATATRAGCPPAKRRPHRPRRPAAPDPWTVAAL